MPIGIIPTTYGEPTRNSFADQWLYSYRILRGLTRKIAPIPAALLPIIATARARGRIRLWDAHGFVSPLEPLHERTVTALKDELHRRGLPGVEVVHAYEFRRPDMADALRLLRRRGCDRAVVVPMYIAEGDFTHGMTRFAVADALERGSWKQPEPITFCALTHDEATTDRLAAALADHCLTEMARRRIAAPARDWAVVLAAHGTVVNPPAGVDNGLLHFAKVLIRLKALLRPHAGLVRIAWLNHTRGGKWTNPPVATTLARVQQKGFSRLVYFPWGFTTDNAETALEGRVALAAVPRPFERVEYLECMNSSDVFIGLLADRLCEHLGISASSPSLAGVA